ncbi:CdaR family transcriptional regulator [Cryobacterium lyxosi]|nr:sugar diacid recognition domain-containing protein [Cryobacterium lyxosi]
MRHGRLPAAQLTLAIYDGQMIEVTPNGTAPNGSSPTGTAPNGTAPTGSSPGTAQITRELAQRLVEQLAPSLVHNVNIMDATGMIIGSMDAARIGTRHDGARDAAFRGEAVHIAPGDEHQGTRPGVNIPLILDGYVVAVVGVTGTPAEVLPVAQVLVLTVHMLLTQERLRDNASWRESATRDILSTLSLGKLTESRLVSGLRGIDVPLQPPWNLTGVFNTAPGANSSVSLLRQLRELSGVVAADINGAVWVLSGSSTAIGLSLLRQRLQQSRAQPLWFLTGRVGATMPQLTGDAERLGTLLARPGLLVPFTTRASPEIRLDSLGLELAIAGLPDAMIDDLAASVLAPLSATLRETARVFLGNELSIAGAARALGVHRNTVVQRLDRIEVLTTLNMRHFSSAVSMRVALAADDALYVDGAQ